MRIYVFIVALMLGAFTNVMASKSSDHKHHKPKPCNCKNTTCEPKKIKKATTIKKSGRYCLAKDIKGVITIAANNVSLNLNSHQVNGQGAPAAIQTNGYSNVTIKNGSVTNPGSLGINATNSEGLQIENVQVYGSNSALALTNSQNSEVRSFKAYNNINTFVDPTTTVGTAIVLIDGCENIKLVDVQANNNTKALTTEVGTTDPGIGIITVNNSTSVTLTDCTTNNNTRTNDNSRFTPLVALFSTSTQFINCQSNNNAVSVDDTHGFAPIQVRLSFDTIIEGCEANGNQMLSTNSFFRAIYFIDSSRNVITHTQACDNVIQTLIYNADAVDASDLIGIFMFAFDPETDNVISHCQVSGNTVVDGGLGNFLIGIQISGETEPTSFENRTLIEYCQVNSNIMQSAGDQTGNQGSLGLFIFSSSEVVVANSNFDGNGGGAYSNGIYVLGEPASVGGPVTPQPSRNIKIINCTANDIFGGTFAYGIQLYGDFDSVDVVRSYVQDCEIIGCQANRCIAGTFGGGINFQNVLGTIVQDCQTNYNSHAGFSIASGVITTSDAGQINSDCTIINCNATDNGTHGFQLDVLGTTNNFLFKDNIALGNTGNGFLDSSTGTNNRYLGNYASNNTAGNFAIAPVTIQLFTLHGTGIYTNVSGDAVHFSSLTNVQAQ